MAKCRREHYCMHGLAEDNEGEVDTSDKDSRRCFKCLVSGYSMFEPIEDDVSGEEE